MSSGARERILARLRSAGPGVPLDRPEWGTREALSREELVARFMSRTEAGATQVIRTAPDERAAAVAAILKEAAVARAGYGPGTPLGDELESYWRTGKDRMPELVPYDRAIEDVGDSIFALDAGITSCYCGVADTGSLLLAPSQSEPRLLSLAPPLHVAVLDESRIFATLSQAAALPTGPQCMPTNVVLATGPSKTSDIEGILVQGVHGPRRVVVVLVSD